MLTRNIPNLVGETFGRLTVLELHQVKPVKWLCSCACGGVSVVQSSKLRSGRTASCGCLAKETTAARNFKHGHTTGGLFTGEYHSWASMLTRCFNANTDSYRHYGGRGITVCDRWRESFENFLADMGPRSAGMSLDRIDVNGNYEPGNCRWATDSEQRLNKRTKSSERKQLILEILKVSPKTLPDLYLAFNLHPECVKKEVRVLARSGLVKVTKISGRTLRGKTLLCEFCGS